MTTSWHRLRSGFGRTCCRTIYTMLLTIEKTEIGNGCGKEALVNAFPHAVDPDGEKTFWRVYRLHGLRNRVSHMETLLEVDAAERTRDVFDLVNSISSPVHDWLTGLNRVPAVIKGRPSA